MDRKGSLASLSTVPRITGEQLSNIVAGDTGELLSKFKTSYAKKNRGKELLDGLKPIYQLQLVRFLEKVSTKDSIISQLFALAQEKPMPFRIRASVFSILVERPPREILSILLGTSPSPQQQQQALRGSGQISSATGSASPSIAPSPSASPAPQELENRLRDWSNAISGYSDVDQVPFSFLALISIARLHPAMLKYGTHIRPVEEKMCQLLINASPDTKASSGTGLFSTLMNATSTAQNVLEPDGSALREFYTTLNLTQNPSHEHLFNVYCFVALRAWIEALYLPQAAGGTGTLEMSTNLQEVVISYCNRIIEQCKLTRPAGNTPPVSQAAVAAVDNIVKKHLEPPIETALVDAVRILDLLCTIDRSLVPSIFPIMKKAFNFVSSHLPISMAQSVLVFLQFFLNHSDAVAYDPEPVFRFYFQTFLAKHSQNVLIAMETFHFCVQNKRALLNRTNVFGAYFPPLLKLYSWAPAGLEPLLSQLVPALVSPSSFVELLHSLLDLPLLAATLERAEAYEKSVGVVGADVRGSSDFLSSGGEFRVLYNHFLRNESGVTINFWHASTALTLLQQFCKSVAVTPRLTTVAGHVPSLLELYFDVLILYGEEMHLKELVPLLFDRLEQLFPLPSFQQETRDVIVAKLLTIFRKYPSFVVTFKEIIINIIGHSKFSSAAVRMELFALCWIVGEYTSTHYLPADVVTPALLSEYYEALELFLYERISLARIETKASSSIPSSSFDPLVAKLLLITISAVTKLSARCQDLSSRVILCLTKLLKQAEFFHPSVQQLANDSIQILKCPSIAPAILDSHVDEEVLPGIDKHSSLSFLLQPTTSQPIVAQLHQLTI